jgi:hypothetical protein
VQERKKREKQDAWEQREKDKVQREKDAKKAAKKREKEAKKREEQRKKVGAWVGRGAGGSCLWSRIGSGR